MKQGLLTLAALSLVVAAAAPASAQFGSFNVFNLAEAYPCIPGTYAANLGISDPQVYAGICPAQPAAHTAQPGILSLRRSGTVLDVNCFAVIPFRQTGPCFVQSYRLIKCVPGSYKCPDVYGRPVFGGLIPHKYYQFGTGVRTWWSLNFTQPGTQFILEVVSVCRTVQGDPAIHKDIWIWQVVADVNTLEWVIEGMHSGAVSTLEIPCIIGEDMYDALKTARTTLRTAITGENKTNIGNAIFDFEALIVANCLFIEVLNPSQVFPGTSQFGEAAGFQPPGNQAPLVTLPDGGGTAIAGVIDTIEHPCCCKLLVDLEWIAWRNGIVGSSPPPLTF